MATYIISDIHGQFSLFKSLLDKINFKYDYSDELYILGDLADFGTNPVDTVLFVEGLCRKYPFIHCCMGNHDAMFLDAIMNNMELSDIEFTNWYDNGGYDTYKEYLDLSESEKTRIYDFLKSLPLEFRTVSAGNRKFHLSHAAPSQVLYTERLFDLYAYEYWYRLEFYEIPKGIESENHIFIYGHTITNHYIGGISNRNYIIPDLHGMKIAIDCGGKLADNYTGYRLAMLDISNMRVMYSDELKWEPIWLTEDINKKLLLRYRSVINIIDNGLI